MLRLDRLDATPLQTDPYDFLVVTDFVAPDALSAAIADYPDVPGPGCWPPAVLDVHGEFSWQVDAFQGDGFRASVEKKFGIDLSGRPTMYTVRGYCRKSDGRIHPDSKTKIITVLLYMNDPEWDSSGGRLRILRKPDDLEDYVAEVPPAGGTLIALRRADHSWHGHHPYEGRRRALQLNWVVDESVVKSEQQRHMWSARLKTLNPFRRTGGDRQRLQ